MLLGTLVTRELAGFHREHRARRAAARILWTPWALLIVGCLVAALLPAIWPRLAELPALLRPGAVVAILGYALSCVLALADITVPMLILVVNQSGAKLGDALLASVVRRLRILRSVLILLLSSLGLVGCLALVRGAWLPDHWEVRTLLVGGWLLLTAAASVVVLAMAAARSLDHSRLMHLVANEVRDRLEVYMMQNTYRTLARRIYASECLQLGLGIFSGEFVARGDYPVRARRPGVLVDVNLRRLRALAEAGTPELASPCRAWPRPSMWCTDVT